MSNMKKQCEIFILHVALSLFDAYAALASAASINHRLYPDKRKYLALCPLLANEPDEVVEVARLHCTLLPLECQHHPSLAS